MPYLRVARLVQIIEDASGGDDSLRKSLNAESLQRRGGEMAQQPLLGRLRGVDPVVEFERGAAVGEVGLVLQARAVEA